MKSIYISENHLRDVFNALTIKEDARIVLNNLVLKFDHSYVKFVYMIFSAYCNLYASIMDDGSRLTLSEAKEVYERLAVLKRQINIANIFIADKFDMLYGISCTGGAGPIRFKDYFYEDMFSRLENLLGPREASTYMEDVFESAETIANVIESNLISVSENPEDGGNIIFYLDIHQEGLLFIII